MSLNRFTPDQLEALHSIANEHILQKLTKQLNACDSESEKAELKAKIDAIINDLPADTTIINP